jgi:C_GCAxxG_C_C family probable redox protein
MSTESAARCFSSGCNCAQSILVAYGAELGLNPEQAMRIASGFGGGMRLAETCGAVTGAFLVIGLKYGYADVADSGGKQRTTGLIRQFAAEFKARNGSLLCRELLGCDISTPEGDKAAREKGVYKTVCPKAVRDAAEMLEGILASHGAPRN